MMIFKRPAVLLLLVIFSVYSQTSNAGWLTEAWNRRFNKAGMPTATAMPNAPAFSVQADGAQVPNRQLYRPNLASLIVNKDVLLTLPTSIQEWLRSETILLSRNVDTMRLMTPEHNDQNKLFTPESGNVFQLTGFWIDADELKVSQSEFPEQLKDFFVREVNGRQQYLLLVHPESYAFYNTRLDLSRLETETFLATATASSRSLLVWKPGRENDVFVGKVSLNAQIGGVDRTIKGVEGAMSVGIDMTLAGAKDLPKNFSAFREVFSAIPTGMDRGAMIIRTIPEDMINGKKAFIPLFALYAKPSDGQAPLLLQMLNKFKETSDADPETLVEKTIIQPFIDEWFNLAMHGVLMEPHAQNVLIGLNKKGIPNGDFRHRDFGGFNINMPYRQAHGYFVPETLPTFSGSVARDYYFDAHAGNYRKSLDNYFDAGFLFNIEKSLLDWNQAGLIHSNIKAGNLREMMMSRIKQRLEESLGDLSHMTVNYDTLAALMERAAQKQKGNAQGLLCEKAFGQK
jgi:hypothetical protein